MIDFSSASAADYDGNEIDNAAARAPSVYPASAAAAAPYSALISPYRIEFSRQGINGQSVESLFPEKTRPVELYYIYLEHLLHI